MNLAMVARFETIRARTTAVTGVADQTLIKGGDPLAATQIQRAIRVIREDRQIVNAVGGHADQVAHWQAAVSSGAGRGRHWNAWVLRSTSRLLEVGELGRHDHGDRNAAMNTQLAGRDSVPQSQLEPVVAALRGRAVIALLGGWISILGKMTPRPHRRG